MARAKFIRVTESGKSALVMVKRNAFVIGASPVYIPAGALPEGIAEGGDFEIPDGYTLVPWIDYETGLPRTTKPDDNGEVFPLHILSYE